MRTKHLFMAMALPVAFAACTSEEFESFQNGQTDLTARRELGNIELAFNGGDAETRLEVGENGIGFSTVDGVGACLVDAPNGTFGDASKPVIQWYGLTNYISSNYLYKTADGGSTWTTDARMVEGNYIFYAPHNESHLVRSSIEATYPNPQIIKTVNGVPNQYSAIQQMIDEGDVMYVGYSFLDSESQTKSISVAMKPIYAYPKITLKNTFGVNATTTSATKDLTIRRIVLLNGSNSFVQNATVNIGTKNDVASASAKGVVGSLFNYGSDDTKYGTWADADNAKLFGCASANVLSPASTNATTGAITLDFETPYVLGKDKTLEINAVVPAGQYAGFKVGVYTNEGYFESTATTLDFIPGQMYPQQEYMENGSLNQSVKGSNLMVEMTTAKPSTGEIVASTEELENLVKTGKGDLTVMPLNADVAYNATVAEYMLQGGVQSITFTAPVTVDNATVIKELVFEGDVTVKGNVEFKDDKISWDDNKVTVKKGATLKLTDFATSTGKISAEEGATVILNSTTVPVLDAESKGTLQVDKDVTITNAASYAGNIVVSANKTLTLSNAFESKGTFTNNGTLSLGAGFTNSGTFTNENMIKGASGSITNKGTFTNKKIVDVTFANQGSYTSATVYTVAMLNVESGAIMNKTVTNTTTGNAANNALVNIINVADGAYFTANSGAIADGSVIYTVENITKNITIPAVCNTLKVTGDVTATTDAITISAADVKTIIVGGDVNAIGANVTFSNATSLEVKGDLYASAEISAPEATDVVLNTVDASDVVNFAKVTHVTLNGNITLNGATMTLGGSSVATQATVAKSLTLAGGGTLTFAATTGSPKLTIAAGATLTNMASTISAGAASSLTIEGATAAGKSQGKMMNYGTVKGAADDYSETDHGDWWSGNTANTAIN